MMSMCPIDYLQYCFDNKWLVSLRFIKCQRKYRVSEFINKTETRTNFPNFFRISIMCTSLLVIIHWNGCLWYLISGIIGFGEDRWVFPNVTTAGNEFAFLGRRYIYSMYWLTLTLATIGITPKCWLPNGSRTYQYF